MKHRAFPGSGPEIEARYQRAGQWILATIFARDNALAWCKANGVRITRAADETINSSGGFLVPNELARAILDIRDYYGAFRRRARVVTMASDATHVPRHTGGPTAFFTAQNNTVSAGTLSLDTVALSTKKIGTLVQLSSELEEDSIDEIVDFVANQVAWAFAAKEDDCAFNGDGTSTYGVMTGICTWALDGNHGKAKVTAASSHNTFLTLDTTDLGSLVSAIEAAAVPRAAWFCSQTAFAQTFCRLSSGAGGGYLDTRDVDGIPTPHYLGFPVVLTQKLPLISTTLSGKVMMAFGDMYSGAVLGQRRAITIARSPERYLDSDQIAILGTERFDIAIHSMGDNTNVGMLAALVAP